MSVKPDQIVKVTMGDREVYRKVLSVNGDTAEVLLSVDGKTFDNKTKMVVPLSSFPEVKTRRPRTPKDKADDEPTSGSVLLERIVRRVLKEELDKIRAEMKANQAETKAEVKARLDDVPNIVSKQLQKMFK